MIGRIRQKLIEYSPAIASGALIVLAFPAFDFFPLAWVALLPLLISLWDRTPREAFRSGYVFGIIYFFGTLYWIYHSIAVFGGVPLAASLCLVFLLCSYLGLYPALFAWAFALLVRKTKLPAMIVAPVVWVVLEFLKSYIFTGFPWASIGYSQYRFLHIIQVADIVGIYGISFLVIAVNGALFDIVVFKRRLKDMPLYPVIYSYAGFAALALMVTASLGYGVWRLGQQREHESLRVSVIQGSIDQNRKWDPAFQKEALDTYVDLSRKAVASSAPELLIWPETAVPFLFDYDGDNTAKLIQTQKDLGAYLLLGSVMVREKTKDKTLLTNSAILLDREGKPVYKYDKIHLVPFGEYVPLKKMLFFVDKVAAGIVDYVPGESYVRGSAGFGSFGTMICYEIIFPGLVRKFYTKGGDFIVTITNDAWFGKTAGPYQHFSMSVFRAIENRKPVVRAANTGISGFIDSSGRILTSTRLFSREFLSAEVKKDTTLTFYTNYGDLFSYSCMIVFIIMFLNVKIWR
ncbi:MAG: apolipoprotein N-acyltransferase [Nitrospirae bacterium]|nr:apolipoprotein N-acyltransferase [Nitrospirota bacterium]